jgi:signal peptidase II
MRRLAIFYAIIAFAIILDQVTKHIVTTNMRLGESIPVIENIFHLTYFRNTGAAFGILQGQTLLLTIVPIILVVAIFVFLTKKAKENHIVLSLGLALICAGGIGNLIDRLRFGAVIDFFDFRVFPIFNIADSCVVIGCGLLIIFTIFLDKSEKPKD